MLIDKKVAGIIRWLERLKKSYSSGAMESALMDAECARADLENLRQVVWAEVRPSERHGTAIFSRIMYSLRTLSLAVLIVMLSVVPLSREVHVPVARNVESEPVNRGPIIVIRDYEPPAKQTVQTVRPETPQLQPRKQTAQKRTVQKRTQSQQILNTPAAKTQITTRTVPYDKVYSLIQTGQRALKNNSTVIKIQ